MHSYQDKLSTSAMIVYSGHRLMNFKNFIKLLCPKSISNPIKASTNAAIKLTTSPLFIDIISTALDIYSLIE